MLSVLSRLTKPGDGKKLNTPTPMSSSLQKKFSRGVDYNMKILIKGDRNVGKSCLLQRLQGGPFVEEYLPTDQIQVAPIHWKYKESEHIVKVEVWEVVDKGRAKKKSSVGLKFDNASIPAVDSIETPALDATFLDVYQNANGVIMMMDITKAWTFEYIKREISTVPGEIPIIILGNHCDMHHHREINSYQVEMFIASTRQTRSGPLRYAESSMRNGFGLRLLHKFFNVPFLQLQRCTLLNQLSVNNQEMKNAFQELDEFEKSEVADYEVFLENLTSKRKQESSNSSIVPRIASDKSPSIVLGGGKPIIPPNVNPLAHANLSLKASKPFLDSTQSTKLESHANLCGEIMNNNNKPAAMLESKISSNQKSGKMSSMPPSTGYKPKDDIDDFCAGVLDHSFLDDISPTSRNHASSGVTVPNYTNHNKQSLDSDSDGETGANPLVIGVQDDLDSSDDNEDKNISKIKTSIAKLNIDINDTAKFSLNNNPDSTAISYDNSSLGDSKPTFSSYNDTIPNRIAQTYLEPVNENYKTDGDFRNNVFSKVNNYHSYCGNRVNMENEQYDSGPELSQPVGYDSSPTWPLDASVRRSPEGGEGASPDAEIKKEKKRKEEKKHKKSKKSSKDKDKSYKDRDLDKGKDKEKKHKEKKHKKKDSNEGLEDFLDGLSNSSTTKETYEVI